MTKMCLASGTQNFGPHHSKISVCLSSYIVPIVLLNIQLYTRQKKTSDLSVCFIKRRPSRTRVEFVFAREQVGITTDAFVHPLSLFVIISSTPCPLSSVFTSNLILNTRQQLSPFFICHCIRRLPCLFNKFLLTSRARWWFVLIVKGHL